MPKEKLSFGFLGALISREDDADFNNHFEEVSLGYCRACKRNKPGVLSEVIKEFLCLKCGYPLEDTINSKSKAILESYESRH